MITTHKIVSESIVFETLIRENINIFKNILKKYNIQDVIKDNNTLRIHLRTFKDGWKYVGLIDVLSSNINIVVFGVKHEVIQFKPLKNCSTLHKVVAIIDILKEILLVDHKGLM